MVVCMQVLSFFFFFKPFFLKKNLWEVLVIILSKAKKLSCIVKSVLIAHVLRLEHCFFFFLRVGSEYFISNCVWKNETAGDECVEIQEIG